MISVKCPLCDHNVHAIKLVKHLTDSHNFSFLNEKTVSEKADANDACGQRANHSPNNSCDKKLFAQSRVLCLDSDEIERVNRTAVDMTFDECDGVFIIPEEIPVEEHVSCQMTQIPPVTRDWANEVEILKFDKLSKSEIKKSVDRLWVHFTESLDKFTDFRTEPTIKATELRPAYAEFHHEAEHVPAKLPQRPRSSSEPPTSSRAMLNNKSYPLPLRQITIIEFQAVLKNSKRKRRRTNSHKADSDQVPKRKRKKPSTEPNIASLYNAVQNPPRSCKSLGPHNAGDYDFPTLRSRRIDNAPSDTLDSSEGKQILIVEPDLEMNQFDFWGIDFTDLPIIRKPS
ncbi:hypothetical protein HDE_06319 [Halotydeus destructor]|nr:hypothetical protein HDE_06319 [Halotydeus destructor]